MKEGQPHGAPSEIVARWVRATSIASVFLFHGHSTHYEQCATVAPFASVYGASRLDKNSRLD